LGTVVARDGAAEPPVVRALTPEPPVVPRAPEPVAPEPPAAPRGATAAEPPSNTGDVAGEPGPVRSAEPAGDSGVGRDGLLNKVGAKEPRDVVAGEPGAVRGELEPQPRSPEPEPKSGTDNQPPRGAREPAAEPTDTVPK